MGHTSHEQTLYLRRRFWDYRITNALAQFNISPHHREKLIFGSWDCDYGTDTPNCGTFLFDASTRQRWKIAGAKKNYSEPFGSWIWLRAECRTCFHSLPSSSTFRLRN
jgi:hypothetical protein